MGVSKEISHRYRDVNYSNLALRAAGPQATLRRAGLTPNTLMSLHSHQWSSILFRYAETLEGLNRTRWAKIDKGCHGKAEHLGQPELFVTDTRFTPSFAAPTFVKLHDRGCSLRAVDS